MEAGEFASVRQAAIAAGIVKVPRLPPDDQMTGVGVEVCFW